MSQEHHTADTIDSKTKLRFIPLGCIVIALMSFLSSQAQTDNIQSVYTKDWTTLGPPRGTLMIIGGAASAANYAHFMALVADPHALVVFVPTAGSAFDERNEAYNNLRAAGAKNVKILHTNDRKEADTEAFAAPLRRARAVFIGGGFQSRLAAAYLNTLTHRLMFEVLERGGVVAGSSAGASIQGSYLYGGLQGGAGPQYVGFGFVRKSVIGQHYIRRNRMGSVAKILQQHPDLLGFGVDESTAAIVRGNELEVIGDGKVAVYDAARPGYSNGQWQEYLLPGDRYDVAARRIVYRATPLPKDQWKGRKRWKNPAEKWKTTGPPRGKLILYGSKNTYGPSIRHFLQSLDSPLDPVVVLSTGNEETRTRNQQIVAELYRLGVKQVTFLHAIHSDIANSKAFAHVLEKAKAVWICDSKSWQQADTYLHTLVHKKLFGVLQGGGIVGGNGEGAAMMASRLFGEPEKYRWHTGYGLVRNTLIVTAGHENKVGTVVREILNKDTALQALVIDRQARLIIEKNQLRVWGHKPVRIYKGSMEQPTEVLPGAAYAWDAEEL